MKENILLVSDDALSVVKIDNGELINYQKNGIEYIHQKQNIGWNNSDTEMFPIIGPTKKNDFKVTTSNGIATLDQHGLLREFNYTLLENDQKKTTFFKEYKKNTSLKNRKYPKNSSKELVYWPYDFSFKKTFILTNECLEIIFEINSDKNMPFMLGYHPAFELSGLSNEYISANNNKITLKDIFNAGSDAYPVLNTNKIILHHITKKDVKITTKGFDNFMLWTEVNSMLCIEPITQFPELNSQNYSEKNMRLSSSKELFSLKIALI